MVGGGVHTVTSAFSGCGSSRDRSDHILLNVVTQRTAAWLVVFDSVIPMDAADHILLNVVTERTAAWLVVLDSVIPSASCGKNTGDDAY